MKFKRAIRDEILPKVQHACRFILLIFVRIIVKCDWMLTKWNVFKTVFWQQKVVIKITQKYVYDISLQYNHSQCFSVTWNLSNKFVEKTCENELVFTTYYNYSRY